MSVSDTHTHTDFIADSRSVKGRRHRFLDNLNRRVRGGESGFSLLELVIGIGLVLVLAIAGFVSYQTITNNSRVAAAETVAQEAYTAAMEASVLGEDVGDAVDAVSEKSENKSITVTLVSESPIQVEAWYGASEKNDSSIVITVPKATPDGEDNSGGNDDGGATSGGNIYTITLEGFAVRTGAGEGESDMVDPRELTCSTLAIYVHGEEMAWHQDMVGYIVHRSNEKPTDFSLTAECEGGISLDRAPMEMLREADMPLTQESFESGLLGSHDTLQDAIDSLKRSLGLPDLKEGDIIYGILPVNIWQG